MSSSLVTPDKSNVTFVLIGAPGCGKSTLIDALVRQSNDMLGGRIKGVEAGQSHSNVDELSGRDPNWSPLEVTRVKLRNENRAVNLIEPIERAEAKLDFWNISISQADYTMLVVSAVDPIDLQLSRIEDSLNYLHAFGALPKIIVVTKMDKTVPPYDKSQFDKVNKSCQKFLDINGFSVKYLNMIPVSGLLGENLMHPSDVLFKKSKSKLSFLKSSEKYDPLSRALQAISSFPFLDRPLRLPILQVHNKASSSDTALMTITGRIAAGKIEVGTEIAFSPGNVTGRVKSIRVGERSVREARQGQCVTVEVELLDAKRGDGGGEIKRGYMAGSKVHDQLAPAKRVGATFCVLDKSALRDATRSSPIMHCHTAAVKCRVVDCFEPGCWTQLQLVLNEPLFIEKGEEDRANLSKFTLQFDNQLIGFGCVNQVFDL